MSSVQNHFSSPFPTVPPSLSAGDHGMRDYYAAQDAQRPSPYTLPDITPYLGLRARLSQVWINRWTVLLLLVLARTLIAITGLNNDLASAQKDAMSACVGVEDMGSTLASMPHYLAAGVNDIAATGVERAVNGLMSMLLLTVTGVEEIVTFYINMLTSTYVCLITLAVAGSLHVAIKIVEDVSSFLNQTLGDIGKDIASDISNFQTGLNGFISALNSVPELLGSKGSVPSLNIDPSLGKLDNLQLPPLDEGLDKLNASIPTFAEVNNFTNSVIRMPFEEVKKLINNSMQAFNFDRSVLSAPPKEQLTFCSDDDGIADFFKSLGDIAKLARKIFIGVLIVAALLACIPMAYRDIVGWRTMKTRAQIVKDRSMDPMDVIYIASRPYTATAGIKIADKLQTKRRQILTRWVIAYATSPAALFILSLAIAGLFSCLCQYILLKVVEKEVPALVNEVEGFAEKVVGSLENTSAVWSRNVNSVIISINNDINHDVFGWVNTTTTAINDTLNEFVDGMNSALKTAFGGTVLYDPITEVMNCLIGLKIAGIEKGLTWVSDNAHVDFPLFPNNTFSLGAAASISSDNTDPTANNFLASPGSSTADAISEAVIVVTNHLADAIRTETLISTIILAIYFWMVLLGLFRALYLAFKRDKLRGEGGPEYIGDIPLEARRPISEAPAYEPPRSPTFAGHYAASREPAAEQSGGRSSEESWQDRKLGFAGERRPAGREHVPRGVRASEYGVMGDQKR